MYVYLPSIIGDGGGGDTYLHTDTWLHSCFITPFLRRRDKMKKCDVTLTIL